jgi:hypothetical protein
VSGRSDDRVARVWLWIAIAVLFISIIYDECYSRAHLRDLQRRVGQLESEASKCK